MTSDEVRAVGRLGALTFAETVTHVERVHGAIAARAFRRASVAGAPARYTHDAISKLVYACVRGAGKSVGLAAAEVASLVPRTDAAPSAKTRLAQSILNAALGDKLAARNDPLAIRMAVRVDGRDVGAIGEAFPDATSAVAVFLHGLGENEDSWGPRFGAGLRADLGFTPVYVRYNTGRHISDNGQELARLLTDLVDQWPTPVDQIVLVGHSMGGLVARSACHYAVATNAPWTAVVTDVFYLGSPHTGAALERLASKLGWALGHLAETRPYADLVNVRSAGIKDLRYGYVIEEDWAGCDADRCLQNHRHEVELLERSNHFAISASVRGSSARLVGDLLVQPASARGPLPVDRHRHLDGLHHFDLLTHPRVYEAMKSWLQAQPFEPSARER
jgi:pimeloyl-ACP methyl ester carboxylesterase